jgi:hypothetical protein
LSFVILVVDSRKRVSFGCILWNTTRCIDDFPLLQMSACLLVRTVHRRLPRSRRRGFKPFSRIDESDILSRPMIRSANSNCACSPYQQNSQTRKYASPIPAFSDQGRLRCPEKLADPKLPKTFPNEFCACAPPSSLLRQRRSIRLQTSSQMATALPAAAFNVTSPAIPSSHSSIAPIRCLGSMLMLGVSLVGSRCRSWLWNCTSKCSDQAG